MVEYDKIFLKKSIVENKNITSEGILAYAGLVIMSNNQLDKLFTNISMIEFALKITNNDKDRTFKDKIKRGLINLSENDVVEIISETEDFKANDGIIIKLNNLRIDTKKEKFILMNMKEIVTILRIKDGKLDIDKLLRYAIILIGTINNNSKVGFTTTEDLAKKSCISDWIIKTKYNKLLEENCIIYTHRCDKSVKCFDGTIRKVNNTYGRYSDKELVIREAQGFYREIVGKNITGNDARGIKQKYNNLTKKIDNGYTPTEEEIQEMNYKISLYNEKYKNSKSINELRFIALC